MRAVDRTSAPNRLDVLTERGTLGDVVRGAPAARRDRQVSVALVIGIGGSGIQTVSRVRSAVLADRPDAAVRQSIQFLGIDAVPPGKQNPPLPPGVRLDASQFLNLTEVPFDPATYIKAQLQSDPVLNTWWDADYVVPPGPITEGLKRERMLGRLAFFRESTRITGAITAAMNAAIDVGHLVELGDAGGANPPSVPVYIVSSSCGGTGSAGFLEVVFSVWSAATARGLVPRIHAFVYLPGAFEAEVLRAQLGAVAAEAQRANAYAFFREVDHFLVQSGQLAPQVGQDVQHGGPDIPDGQLIHQLYLLDGVMQGIGMIGRVTDLYEITAEAMFQFLLTDAGRPLVTVDMANTEQALGELDHWKKPRRYCSLGIARVLFPGDTYRQHLAMRYVDWIIDDSLLASPNNLSQYVRDSDVMQRLDDMLPGLLNAMRQYQPEEEVEDFLETAERIPRELLERPTPEEAAKWRTLIDRDSPLVVRSMQRALVAHARELRRTGERAIVDAVLTSGEGVPFGLEVLRRVRRHVDRALTTWTAASSGEAAAAAEAEDRVGRLIDELTRAASRRPHERVVAAAGKLFGKARTVHDIARDLGPALSEWARAIHDQQIAESEARFLTEMRARTNELRTELERALERLRVLSDRARDHWQWDELLGKDAGPVATSVVIPHDVAPEIEDSRFSKKWYADLQREHGDKLVGEPLAEFVDRWTREATNRGVFSLGADDPDEQRKAEASLLSALNRDAEERALHTSGEPGGEAEDEPAGGTSARRRSRLPSTLEMAARDADETDRLADGVRSLEALSRHVCWSWNQGRFQLGRDFDGATRQQEPRPAVTSVVLHDKSAAELVSGAVDSRKLVTMDDAERIIALSVEWAVPLHALHAVDRWRIAYDRVRQARARAAGTVPPAHIDQRWEDYLKPLVPTYGEPEVAAKVLAKAFLLADILEEERPRGAAGARSRDERGPLGSLFAPGRTNRPMAPVRRHDLDERWVGQLLDVGDGGVISVRPETIDLGATWRDLLARVSEEPALQRSVNEVMGVTLAALGVDAVSAAADVRLEHLDKLADNPRLLPAERGAVADIAEGVVGFRDDLLARH